MEHWTGHESRALRRALRMSVREFAARLGISERMASRWEAGRSAITPRPVNQAALDTLLESAPEPARERFATEVRGGTIESDSSVESEEDVRRREFLRLAGFTAATAWVPHALNDGDSTDLIAAVAGPTAHYRRLEQTFPTAPLSDVVRGHTALAEAVVRNALPTPAGYAALAELAGFSAWLHLDQGSHSAARARYQEAIGYAERAEHRLLTAYMRASLGAFATEAGDARSGLALLERTRADVRADVPAPAHAWLAAQLAVTHAALGNHRAARGELRTCTRLADDDGEQAHWPWMFTFDSAKAARYGAQALGALGDVAGARETYELAAPSLSAPKARAVADVDHAATLADGGHLAEACDFAVSALHTGHRFRSERIISGVRRFRSGLPVRCTAAIALDEALAGLYDTPHGGYAPAP